MKKIITVLLLVLISNSSFSQKIKPSPVLTKQDYLQKSKKQKTIGWILAGTGVTSVVISIATLDGTEIFSSITGNAKPINRFGALFFGGCGVALSSIPFFISSGKNNRRAMTATTSLKFDKLPEHLPGNTQRNIYPALSININLK